MSPQFPLLSSSLVALDILVPPSPELVADVSITSGDIPIIFESLSPISDNESASEINAISDIFTLSTHARNSASTIGTFGISSQERDSYFRDTQTHRPASPSPTAVSHLSTISPSFSRIKNTITSSNHNSKQLGSYNRLYSPPKSQQNLVANLSDSQPTLNSLAFASPTQQTLGTSTPPPTPSRRRNLFSSAISHAFASTKSIQSLRMTNTEPTSPSGKHHRSESEAQKSTSSSTISLRPAHLTTLPNSLSFLRTIAVEALIDQEGFRSATPKFRLAGFSPKSHSLDANVNVVAVADFIPTVRQTFHFHCAPFEAAPMLRRLTITEQGSRDHLSREATICLKSNGVYTIRGIETSNLPASFDVGDGKLRWKFEYMVSDRRVGANKVMKDEKTMTPLLFSCSPLLLHPLQGKKIRLIHVMRKTMTPNLVAEKMEPPTFTPGECHKQPVQHTQPHSSPFPKSLKWNLHRRAQSHTAPHANEPAEDKENREDPSMHRRSASAVERTTFAPLRKASATAPCRHILSNAYLSELVTHGLPDETFNKQVCRLDVGEFDPLCPPPRRPRARQPIPRSEGRVFSPRTTMQRL